VFGFEAYGYGGGFLAQEGKPIREQIKIKRLASFIADFKFVKQVFRF